MASTFLSPLGDYSAVADFCGVKSMPPPAGFERAVDAAARAVRSKCGPVLSEALTHRTYATRDAVVLPYRVAALTSVTPTGGTADTLTDYYADGQLVRRVDGGAIAAGTIAYTSGWAHEDVPADLLGAGFEIARHLWVTQLGNQRNGGSGADQPGAAWLWPRQAEALAADYMLAPLGFA